MRLDQGWQFLSSGAVDLRMEGHHERINIIYMRILRNKLFG